MFGICICIFLPFTFIYFIGIYVADFNSIYVLITGGPIKY